MYIFEKYREVQKKVVISCTNCQKFDDFPKKGGLGPGQGFAKKPRCWKNFSKPSNLKIIFEKFKIFLACARFLQKQRNLKVLFGFLKIFWACARFSWKQRNLEIIFEKLKIFLACARFLQKQRNLKIFFENRPKVCTNRNLRVFGQGMGARFV